MTDTDPSLDAGALASTIADMAVQLHHEPTMEDTVDRLLEFALKALGCAHAGVIFVHKGKKVETIAATDDVVAKLDAIQMQIGQGPDIEVLSDRTSVLVRDVRTEARWPEWASLVASTGIRSMLGMRLYTSSTTIGSLNFYDPEPDHFDLHDRQVAHVLARHAAIALDNARDSENLWKAIDARKLIGQAQGILMERFAIDADQAFAVLMRYSQHHNVKLHTVAEQLVMTRSLPPAPPQAASGGPSR
ncbi:GAF and ANTAR domain-containing protein [Nocardioides gansuensis]|nr:GAF and ANTAR domain-containing protein [Nocardioides gansuensis]